MNAPLSSLGFAATALVMALLLPATARADDESASEPERTDASDRTKAREANTRIIAGTAIFAASYAGSAGLAYWASTKHEDASELYVPVVGPVIAIVNIESNIQTCYAHGKHGSSSTCSLERLGSFVAYPLLALDAIAQGGGLMLLIGGLAGGPSEKPAPTRDTASRGRVTPYTTGTTFGLTGTF